MGELKKWVTIVLLYLLFQNNFRNKNQLVFVAGRFFCRWTKA
jgi:hypothetical protein